MDSSNTPPAAHHQRPPNFAPAAMSHNPPPSPLASVATPLPSNNPSTHPPFHSAAPSHSAVPPNQPTFSDLVDSDDDDDDDDSVLRTSDEEEDEEEEDGEDGVEHVSFQDALSHNEWDDVFEDSDSSDDDFDDDDDDDDESDGDSEDGRVPTGGRGDELSLRIPGSYPPDGAGGVDGAETVAKQQSLRRQIVGIQGDEGLSAQEKARKIQQLMSGNYAKTMYSNTLPIPSLEAGIESLGQITDEEKIKTWHDYDAQILGCKHYQRGARVQARCCGKWFTCRFCHDEVSDHNMNRHQTTTMLCMHCLHPQPASSTCLHCSTPLACYYCPTCKLWDDDATKHIYHCDACGICRIGRGLGLDYFHCEKCNACMAIALQGRHRCIERNLECDCPICGEFMFTSTSTVIFMPCGHCIHQTCHSTHIQTSYQCPTCLKSLADMTRYFSRIDAMLASHTMPAEYADLVSNVYCNDCERRTRARYHFVYHKCGGCGGYNTKVVGVERGGEGEEAGV